MSAPTDPLPPTASEPACTGSTDAYGGPPAGTATGGTEGVGPECPLLGPYRLLQSVRTWRDGTVYAARHSTLERVVLLHALEGKAADAACRADFARRAQALSSLAHPNVASGVLEATFTGPTPYLALEESPGEPLSGFGPRGMWGRQREGLFPNRRLGLTMLDAVRGLAAVHRAGLTHGNLRPSALRVDPDGRVIVAGLGDDEATAADAAPFAAPVRLGLTDPRQRDLYAMGACFYALVTGAPPSEEPPPVKRLNPGVSAALSCIVARCLARTGHYASADELAADLEGVLQTDTVRVPWGKRIVLLIEALLALFGGAGVVALAAKLAFGYQESENGTFPEFMVLGAPALLYFIFTNVVLGRTLLRRWQGFEVADLSGDPASRRRRLSRAALEIGLVAGLPIALGWFMTRAGQEGAADFMFAFVTSFMVFLTALYGFSWLTLQYRHFLGESLTGEDVLEAMTLLPHDRLTDTRLVLHRPAPLPAVAAPAVRKDAFGPVTDRIDQYDLGGRLGAGGMGTVYRAWDRSMSRPVAVKLVGEALEGQPLGRERFEREARLAAQLNHPNVAKVYGVGLKGGRPYIAMELVEGETLEQRVRRAGPLAAVEAWRLVLQAAQALQAADRIGIVHRDIKPSNLMVTLGGTLKVMDFGVSRWVERELALTDAGAVVGTPLFMSPEQATGKPVDGRSDMYSLGLTLFYLLTGRTAFSARNRMDLLAQQLNGPAPDLAGQVLGLTDAQAAVVARMLARRPEARFPDYASLIEALRTESPELAPPAAAYFRLADGAIHAFCCVGIWMGLFLLVRYALPALAPESWRPGLQAAKAWSPGVLLAAQCLVTLLTVFVVVYRPPLQPFRPRTAQALGGLPARLGNLTWQGLSGLLMLWPTLHRSQGLRVTRWDGRRLGVGRAAWRFAVGYPLLLPWAVLAFLPGLSVEALALPLGVANVCVIAASAALLLLHPQRRSLVDLAAGTREVRVPPPVLLSQPPRRTRPIRPAVAVAQAVGALLLVAGAWGFSAYGLYWFKTSQQAALADTRSEAARNRLAQSEAFWVDKLKVSPTEARLTVIASYCLFEVKNGRTPNEQGLTDLYSQDCLISPRGGKINVVWDVNLSGPPAENAARLVAYEATPDSADKSYAVTGVGLTRYLGAQDLQALVRPPGR